MKYTFEFLVDHTVEIPATTLETKVGGECVDSINLPASTICYKQGQQVIFRNKKDAGIFADKMGDKIRRL